MWIWISESGVLRCPTRTTHTVLLLRTFLLFHLYKDGRDFSVLLTESSVSDPVILWTDSITLFHLLKKKKGSHFVTVSTQFTGCHDKRSESWINMWDEACCGAPFNRTTTEPTENLTNTPSSIDYTHPEGPVDNVARVKIIHYRR